MQDAAKKLTAPDGGGPDTPAPSEPQAGYYGLQILPPLTAVVELAAIVMILLAIDWIWPALDINNLQPSPYWVPVLLLSLQYGTASGTLAVIVAIAVYFSLVTLPEQGVGENEFTYRLRILGQPILWIAAAVLLGQFRMVQISAKRELIRSLKELEGQRDTLADYATRLRSRCDALERDIASRPWKSASGLLASLAELSNPEGARPDAIARCLETAFPGAAVSLYLRQGSALVKTVAAGWPDAAPWAVRIPSDHPLHMGVVGAKSRFSILNEADETVLAGHGLAAVPVIDPRTGRVLGMIKLELGDAQVVVPGLVLKLDVLAAAVEPALQEQGGLVSLRRSGNEPGDSAATPLLLRPPQRLLRAASETAGTEFARPKAGPKAGR